MSISNSIQKPPISFGKTYEVDEMMTFIGNKERRICITYALERQTKEATLKRIKELNNFANSYSSIHELPLFMEEN